jgi:HEAT repeat protein
MRTLRIAVFIIAVRVFIHLAQADNTEQLAADQNVLRTAGVEIEAGPLLEYFKKRTLFDDDLKKVKELVRKLGDDVIVERNRAANELIALGPPVRLLLREALGSEDVEVVRRATNCLEAIERDLKPDVTAAAARMLLRHKPPSATKALLDFLPFAEDESTAEEVRHVLVGLALRDGKPDSILIEGTSDRMPVRRAASIEALLLGNAMAPEEGRKFLKDNDTSVRLAAALALTRREDKESVPALIALLTDLPSDQAGQVEDELCRLAGDKAPAVSLGDDDASRKKCREAWSEWWTKNAAAIDLKALGDSRRMLGYTLITTLDNRNTGKVYELGPDGKLRWTIGNLSFPIDAQVLPGERVLIAEMNGNRVTERDCKTGEIIKDAEWSFQLPVACRRLPNGNTFIAGRNGMVEYDRNKKEVFKYDCKDLVIWGAVKLRNGEYGVVTSMGTFTRIDSTGKESNKIDIGETNSHCLPDVLPSGRVLIPIWGEGKVVEFNADGKGVWTAQVNGPVCASRLPNGNTLIASNGNSKVVELDRNGKEVWQHSTDDRPWRVRRR